MKLFSDRLYFFFLQSARDALLEKQDDLTTINEKGDEILLIDNNSENVSRVNGRFADLKQSTEDTLKKLNSLIGQLEKDLESTKKFVNGCEELESDLIGIQGKIKAMEPAGKDTEKIKEQMQQVEVS